MWNQNNPEKYFLNSARSRARRKGIEFTLQPSDIDIPEICPYLKTPMTLVLGKGKLETNPSLDRIDPTKGYIPGNIQVISKKANTMKSNATKEELLTFARSVLHLLA